MFLSKVQHLDRDRQAEISIADRVLSSANSRIHTRPVGANVALVVAAGSNQGVAQGRVGGADGGHARAVGGLAHGDGDLLALGEGVGQVGVAVAGGLLGRAGGHIGIGCGAAHSIGGVAAGSGQRGALGLVGVALSLAGRANSAACSGRRSAVANVVGFRKLGRGGSKTLGKESDKSNGNLGGKHLETNMISGTDYEECLKVRFRQVDLDRLLRIRIRIVSITIRTKFYLPLYIYSSLLPLLTMSMDIMIMVKGLGMSNMKWTHRITKIDKAS